MPKLKDLDKYKALKEKLDETDTKRKVVKKTLKIKDEQVLDDVVELVPDSISNALELTEKVNKLSEEYGVNSFYTKVDKALETNLAIVDKSLMPKEIRELAIKERDSLLSTFDYTEEERKSKIFEDTNPVLEQLVFYKNGKLLEKEDSKPLAYYTKEEIEPILEDYFMYCATQKFNPSVINLSLYLGINTTTLYDWASGRQDVVFRDSIIRAINMIQAVKDDLAERSKINASVHIFNSKNFYGMSDKVDTRITVEDNRKIDSVKAKLIIDTLPD